VLPRVVYDIHTIIEMYNMFKQGRFKIEEVSVDQTLQNATRQTMISKLAIDVRQSPWPQTITKINVSAVAKLGRYADDNKYIQMMNHLEVELKNIVGEAGVSDAANQWKESFGKFENGRDGAETGCPTVNFSLSVGIGIPFWVYVRFSF
jgi:hypothetical protein